MADAKMLNKAKAIARLRALPAKVAVAVGSQLAGEVETLVEAQKAAAPVDETSADPGSLAEGIRFYPNPDRPLSYRVISDARDDKGQPIASHVEFGHRAADGSHVGAQPSFWPVFRARRRGIRQRLSRTALKAIRAEFPEGGS